MENYLWIVPCVLGYLALKQLALIARSLQSLEEMTSRLLSLEGIEGGAPAEPSPRVRQLAANPAERVAAIRAYRQQTGLGLREAKAVVDELARTRTGPG